MDVELLGEDELLVELEVRGLSDAARGAVTPELKNALAERFRVERADCTYVPWDQHEAAVGQPEQEDAICLRKLHAVQQHLSKGIRAGKTAAEIYPQLVTRLTHVQGRVNRNRMCGDFGPQSTRLHIVMQVLCGMVADLMKGIVVAADIAERLSRVVIKIDQPTNEEEEEIMEENWENEGDSEEVVEHVEMRDEVEEKIDEADIEASVEEKGCDEEEDDKEIGKEDQVVDVAKDIGDVARQADHGRPKLSDIKRKGSGRRERCSRRKLRRDASKRVRYERLQQSRVMARLWEIEWRAMRTHMPVEWSLRVLDLRVQDEVLARANRRIGQEDV